MWSATNPLRPQEKNGRGLKGYTRPLRKERKRTSLGLDAGEVAANARREG